MPRFEHPEMLRPKLLRMLQATWIFVAPYLTHTLLTANALRAAPGGAEPGRAGAENVPPSAGECQIVPNATTDPPMWNEPNLK